MRACRECGGVKGGGGDLIWEIFGFIQQFSDASNKKIAHKKLFSSETRVAGEGEHNDEVID